MSWIEEHPFYVAVVVSSVLTLFAIAIHRQTYHPAQWDIFIQWVPAIFFIPIVVATVFSILKNKNGTDI